MQGYHTYPVPSDPADLDMRDGTVDAAASHAAALTAMPAGGLDISLVLGTPNGPEHIVHEWFPLPSSRSPRSIKGWGRE